MCSMSGVGSAASAATPACAATSGETRAGKVPEAGEAAKDRHRAESGYHDRAIEKTVQADRQPGLQATTAGSATKPGPGASPGAKWNSGISESGFPKPPGSFSK